ncbi:MAG: hypothetical protein Q8J70_00745 [Thiobacillus sp.]|nr:hypothetical protein [Thiobacillus sp.]
MNLRKAAVRWPGLPAASYFLLLRQKKVTKEKATPLIPETPKIEPAGWAAKNSPRFAVLILFFVALLKHLCR